MAQLEKIMSIYYGSNKLPYKDEDRQINYPVLGGNLFIGENNVTTIRFYVDRIGGNEFTWLAVVKLPDGSKVYRQLSQVSQEGYVDFDISSVYTSQQGAIFISLQGYTSQNTNVTIDDENYIINGDPDILVTGVVKVMVNYAPQILNMGTDISYSQYQKILALSTEYFSDDDIKFFTFYEHLASEDEVNRYVETYKQLVEQQNKTGLIGSGIISATSTTSIVNNKQVFACTFEWTCTIRCPIGDRDKMLGTL